MKLLIALSLLITAVGTVPATAQSKSTAPWEVGAGYNFVHSNAPPSGCGCFSLNGGNASIARGLNPSFSIVGEFGGVTNSNVDASSRSLTLLTYLAGPRYRFVPSRGRVTPFAEVLVGAAHASGGLYAPAGSSSGSSNSFAASIGGGVDAVVTPRVSIRLVQADYLLTLLPNSVNNRQNNISLSAGILFHFGGR